MIIAASQLERGLIRDRLAGGLRRKVRDGGYYVATTRPYGYARGEGGALAPHPVEAGIVRQIFEWADAGLSSYRIARKLDDQGTSTPESSTTVTRNPFRMVAQDGTRLPEESAIHR